MTEAVETSTFMEGATSVRTTVAASAPWKPPQQQRASAPSSTRAAAVAKLQLEEVPLPPLSHVQQDQDYHGVCHQEQAQSDEARRRMALFQAQRLLLAARPFDSIEYFYVHQELKKYLWPGKEQDQHDEEEEDDAGASGGGGWWRWITTLLCGSDAAASRSRAAPILV